LVPPFRFRVETVAPAVEVPTSMLEKLMIERSPPWVSIVDSIATWAFGSLGSVNATGPLMLRDLPAVKRPSRWRVPPT